jgi:hypothetical protein
VEAAYHPTWFVLTFTIDKDGRAALAGTDPVVDAAALACLRAAFSLIVFPPQPGAIEVSYPVRLPVGGAPQPTPPGGCTSDTDCAGARVCAGGICREGGAPPVAPGPAPPPRPYTSGAGLFVPGVISTGVGAAMLLAATILSKQGGGPDASRLVFSFGLIASLVGGGLVPGAITLASRSSGKLGGKESEGFLATGWILYGLYAATAATLFGLCVGVDYGEHAYAYSAPTFGFLFLMTVVNAVGWGIARGRASAAARRTPKEAAGALVIPLVAPAPGGATAGVVVVY